MKQTRIQKNENKNTKDGKANTKDKRISFTNLLRNLFYFRKFCDTIADRVGQRKILAVEL